MSNVAVYRESPMTADDIVEFGFEHVVVATGARWRGDGVGRWHTTAVPTGPDAEVLTPDDLFAGRRPRGPQVIVYDDDHYYLGGVLAELLRREGYQVSIVTRSRWSRPGPRTPSRCGRIQRRLIELGIIRCTETVVTGIDAGSVLVADVYTATVRNLAADSVVMVTARLPNEELLAELTQHHAAGRVTTVRAVGDCLAPGHHRRCRLVGTSGGRGVRRTRRPRRRPVPP